MERKVCVWLIAMAVVALCLVVPNPALAQGKCQVAGKSEILFGGTLPLTGVFSDDGKWYKNSYDLWVDDVNSAGGILGCKARLILYDDKSDAASIVGLWEKLITVDKVDILVSTYTSGLLLPASSVALKYQKLLVGGGSCATPVFTKGNPYIFSTMAGADVMHGYTTFQGFKTLPAEKRPKSMAVVYFENVWGIGVAKGLRVYAKELGIPIVVDEGYSPKTSDFTPLVSKLKAANPDMVFGASYCPDTVNIVRTMNELGWRPKGFWSGSCGTHTHLTKWLGPLAEGVMSDSHWEPSVPYAGAAEFAQKYKARYGEEVYDYPATAWASLQVYKAAIEATKSIDQQKLLEYVRTRPFDTIVGPQQFLPTGMPTNFTFVSTQIQDGKRVIWYPERDVVFGKAVKNSDLRYPAPVRK